MKTLAEIAELNGLDLVETTSQRNGYPSQLEYAIIGFENFSDAEQMAKKYSLSVEIINKKDGWNLWYRTGDRAYEPFKNSCEDFGDNYSQFEKISEDEFFDEEIYPAMEDKRFFNFSDLQEFIDEKNKLWQEIENMEEDEIVITYLGRYDQTIKKESMYFYNDTNHYTIALLNR